MARILTDMRIFGAAALVAVTLILPAFAPQKAVTVEFHNDTITINTTGASVDEVLSLLGNSLGFEVERTGSPPASRQAGRLTFRLP
jgi:hypothetical protein